MSSGSDDSTIPPTQPQGPTVPPTQPLPSGEAPAERPAAPLRLGRYEVVRELARGGMGVVYVARDPQLDREVAIKQCLQRSGLDSGALFEERARFMREAKAVARLQHPHIVQVFDVGEEDASSYIVMDLIRGESLQDRLRREGPLPEREVARLGLLLAQALAYAHGRSILHRDLKPHNVLVDEDGEPRLTDFGLAKVADLRELETAKDDPSARTGIPAFASDHSLTVTGQLLGTPAYMSPEQAEGAALDVRSDVYGLGATLYALLTGDPPHTGSSLVNVISAVLNKDPLRPSARRPGVDARLEAIVLRCLARDPAQRYGSAQELATALAGWLEGGAPRATSLLVAASPVLGGLIVAAIAIGLGLRARGRRAPAPPVVSASADAAPTPTPSATPARTVTIDPPTPAKTVGPTLTPTAAQPLHLEQSFAWTAPAGGAWRKRPAPDPELEWFALVKREPDRFARIRRGTKRLGTPAPWWRIDGDVQATAAEGEALLASPLLLLTRTGPQEARLLELEGGRVRLPSVRKSPEALGVVLSDDWMVQVVTRGPRRKWLLQAQRTSPEQTRRVTWFVDRHLRRREKPELLIGTGVAAVVEPGQAVRLWQMPAADSVTGSVVIGALLEPRRGRPLAISPRDDRLAVQLGGRIELRRVKDLVSRGTIRGATCDPGTNTAQFSPDGRFFAWVGDGTVHVVPVADATKRLDVPKRPGWVAFFFHADTSLTVLGPDGVRRYELEGGERR